MKNQPPFPVIQNELFDQLAQTAYLNGTAAPGFDLCQISREGTDFATNFIARIFSDEETKMSFISNLEITNELADFYHQAYRQNGQKDYVEVGLGFPMFYILENENPIMAPLFIWPVRMTPDYADRWHIEVNRSKVMANHLLVDFLEQKYQVNCLKKLEACLTAGAAMDELIYKTCYDLLVEMGWKDERSTISMKPIPATIDEKNGSIRWSAMLNHYQVNEVQFLKTARTLTELQMDSEPKSWNHSFGALPMNAPQQQVLDTLLLDSVIANGGSGTGRYDLATSAISNALSNRKKVLVVSTDNTALASIYQQLEHHQIGEFTLPLFPKFKPNRFTATTPLADFDQKAFNLYLQKAIRHYHTLSKQYQAATQPIFGHHNWTNTVGLLLQVNQKASSATLNAHLHIEKYNWSFETYNKITKTIQQGIGLYRNLGTIAHPLKALNDIHFLDFTFKESKTNIENQVKELRERGQVLHQKYIHRLHEYAQELTKHYNDQVHIFQQKSEDLLELIADLSSQHGKEGTTSTTLHSGKLKLAGLFSKRHKNILETQREIHQQYQDIQDQFQAEPLFEFQFSKIKKAEKITAIQSTISNFKQDIYAFQQNIPYLTQQHQETLSATNQVTAINYDTTIQELEADLKNYLDFLNQSRLFKSQFSADAHTIIGQQNYLEQIDNQIIMIDFNLRDFDLFYDWQRYWLQLSPAEQEVMLALTKINPPDWEAAFQSWYLHQFLTQYHDDSIPENQKYFERFWESYAAVQYQLPAQISTVWKQKNSRQPTVDLSLYQNSKSEFSAIQFLEKMSIDAYRISEKYPTILMSPNLAQAWINTNHSPFDLVIILGSNRLPLSRYFGLLKMAPKVLAFSDSTYSGHSSMVSVCDFLVDQNTPTVSLTDHQRAGSKALAQLNYNHFDTAKNYRYFNKTKVDHPILAKPVEIAYRSEVEINNQFATTLEAALKSISEQPGITAQQLDIVVEDQDLARFLFYKLFLKRIGHTEMATVLQKLFPKGIRLFPATHQVDSDTDILIYIPSVNATDFDIQNYQHQLSRIKKQLIFIYPKTEISTLAGEDISKATPLGITELIYDKKVYPTPTALNDFMAIISNTLESNIGADRIEKQFWLDEIYLPILVKSSDKKSSPTAIIIDGIADRYQPGSAVWERQFRKHLANKGIQTIFIWSVDWWKNPAEASRNLINAIHQNTTVHAT